VETSPEDRARQQARTALLWLCGVYALNVTDRQILSVLAQPVKQDLGLSDTQMGLLLGLTFALLYSLLGIPMARWADRRVRTSLIAIGLAFWAAMTALSGFARNFAQLALARAGVGIGEASYMPAAYSLLSDHFPPERRATALGILHLGPALGILVGNIAGGWLAEHYGWRTAFFVLGAPGILVAVLFHFFVREPARERLPQGADSDSTFRVIRYLGSRRSFNWLIASAAIHGFSGYGSGMWLAVFMIRVHDLSVAQAGLVLGPISGLVAGLGALTGGRLADVLARRDVRWNCWISALGSVLALPLWAAFILAPSLGMALLAYVPAALLNALYLGPTNAMLQGVARPRMRAMSAALTMLLINLIGLGLGPLAVGALNDHLAPTLGDEAVRYSLLVMMGVHLFGAIASLLATASLRDDLRAAQVSPGAEGAVT
jgi:predicted MFS family arabinose efflux permease